jgi:hypothetical protein
VVIIIFIVGIVMQLQPYISDIQAAKKHVESHEQRKAYYNKVISDQQIINAKLEKDFYHLSQTYKKDIRNFSRKLDAITNELIRLKLVSTEPQTEFKNVRKNKRLGS